MSLQEVYLGFRKTKAVIDIYKKDIKKTMTERI